MVASLVQERSEHTGACSGKAHEDEGIRASVTGGEAERAGSVQGDLIPMYKCLVGQSKEDRWAFLCGIW